MLSIYLITFNWQNKCCLKCAPIWPWFWPRFCYSSYFLLANYKQSPLKYFRFTRISGKYFIDVVQSIPLRFGIKRWSHKRFNIFRVGKIRTFHFQTGRLNNTHTSFRSWFISFVAVFANLFGDLYHSLSVWPRICWVILWSNKSKSFNTDNRKPEQF